MTLDYYYLGYFCGLYDKKTTTQHLNTDLDVDYHGNGRLLEASRHSGQLC